MISRMRVWLLALAAGFFPSLAPADDLRHASGWYEGESVLMPFGRRPDPREVRVSLRSGVFIDPNGQHAVIVERRRRADYTSTYRARVVDLQPTTPALPVEADREAEAAADRELIGKLAQ